MARKAESSTKEKKGAVVDGEIRDLSHGSADETAYLTFEIACIVGVAVGIFVGIAMYTTAAGLFGGWIQDLLVALFGGPAYFLPPLIVGFVVYFWRNGGVGKYGKNAWLSLGMFTIVSSIWHMMQAPKIAYMTLGAAVDVGIGGGYLGGGLAEMFTFLFGSIGGALLLVALFLVAFIKTFNLSVTNLIWKGGELLERSMEWIKGRVTGERVLSDKDDEREERRIERLEKKDRARRMKELALDESESAEYTVHSIEEPPFDLADENKVDGVIEAGGHGAHATHCPPLRESEVSVTSTKYKKPSLKLLKDIKGKSDTKLRKKVEATAHKLIETLESFGVGARILAYSVGPTVTRYELQPNSGVKINKIVNLADDIALNLAARGVRIEAPIPGKAAIGIEIPNEEGALVGIREVLVCSEFAKFPSQTAFALGKDITGKAVVVDISRMPHLLIAGSTGSGKSVCVNALIVSLLFKASPDDVKLILIDPKMVELGGYNGIPHLLIPVVTDPHKASGALQWAVSEMTKRYKMFANNNVRDMKSYNAFAEKQGWDKMPQIIIVIDELADLMMVAPNDVEDSICRLAQMARAAGMHLVVATQRPSVDVITGVIKANIPSRISFAVSSQVDSRTILDASGAEKLIGRGDMLYMPLGATKPVRVQGAYVTDKEVSSVVDYVKAQVEELDYDQDVLDQVENYESPAQQKGAVKGKESAGGADDLLPQAIELALEVGQASVAMYQRRLKVGYQRAAKIIDQMEERKIIGRFDGTKPRELLITRAQWNEMLMNQTELADMDRVSGE